MEKIGVIDYGMGNLHSLGKALERVAGNQRIVISYDPEELIACDRLVLPGVGGVKAAMDELRRLELNDLVVEASRKRPLLGICLGMQVLLDRSEENGGVPALGLIPGDVIDLMLSQNDIGADKRSRDQLVQASEPRLRPLGRMQPVHHRAPVRGFRRRSRATVRASIP